MKENYLDAEGRWSISMSSFVGCINDQTKLDRQAIQCKKIATHHEHRDTSLYIDEHIQLFLRYVKDDKPSTQSFPFENERYWGFLNGKIYNYIDLKTELEANGWSFQTESASELAVALYDQCKEKVASKLRGGFTLIVWDKQEEQLFGARDHFGIKPFFYIENKAEPFIFSSEKKDIVQMFENDVLNAEALQHYLTYQYVPEPLTMSEGIQKLEPGCYFKKNIREPIKISRYWQATFLPVVKAEDVFVKDIRKVIIDSVNTQMQNDTSVGSFLSGGIDSSFIVSIAKQFNPSIKTFSVGFSREGYSEIEVAKETAEKIGVKNISYVISAEEYMNELPKIMWHLADPLADPACVPLYFVAREARKHVNVALSGEGADELFGGYNIYREPQSLAIFENIPYTLRKFLKRIARLFPEGIKGKSFIERGCTPMEMRYIGNAKMFSEAEKSKLLFSHKADMPYTEITTPLFQQCQNYGPVEKMQYIDIHTWLKGDILLKAEQMTRAHSLEVRLPFLDTEVFEVAKNIPASLKTANGTTKYILRKAAEGIVPDHILHRKKLGFPVPIRHWLKNEMYDWARQLINDSHTGHLLNKQYILELFDKHCRGKMDYSRKIWTVLMFMLWHRVFIEKQYSFSELGNEDRKQIRELQHL